MKCKNRQFFGNGDVCFTLIELMVVITIIVIIASLLLPSLKQANKTAKGTLCIGNFRQIGLALIDYMDNYSYHPPTNSGSGWMTVDSDSGLGTILKDVQAIGSVSITNNRNSKFRCPIAHDKAANLGLLGAYTIGGNFYIRNEQYKDSQIYSPSKLIFCAETQDLYSPYFFGSSYADCTNLAFRHTFANILYFDGHVGMRSRLESIAMGNVYSTGTQNYYEWKNVK